MSESEYTTLLSLAVESREKKAYGANKEMDQLYRFWSFYLRDKNRFSSEMYQQFKAFALEDAQFAQRFGLECLFRFYRFGLETNFGGDVFEDFQDLTLLDHTAGHSLGFNTFRQFFLYNHSKFPNLSIRPSLLDLVQNPTDSEECRCSSCSQSADGRVSPSSLETKKKFPTSASVVSGLTRKSSAPATKLFSPSISLMIPPQGGRLIFPPRHASNSAPDLYSIFSDTGALSPKLNPSAPSFVPTNSPPSAARNPRTHPSGRLPPHPQFNFQAQGQSQVQDQNQPHPRHALPPSNPKGSPSVTSTHVASPTGPSTSTLPPTNRRISPTPTVWAVPPPPQGTFPFFFNNNFTYQSQAQQNF